VRKSTVLIPWFVFVLACSSTKPPEHPPLSPTIAEQLLHYDTRADNHLKNLKRLDPTCVYKLQLPDQSTHPESIEIDHIAFCSGRNDLKAFDTRADFQWNKAAGKWELVHVGS
jgi:hypothetical protein